MINPLIEGGLYKGLEDASFSHAITHEHLEQ